MIHLSDPAAYHDKRFKNNPTKRKTMKTPMPEPALPNKRYWIESQLRSAMVAAYIEGVEDAAETCRDMKQECGEPDSMQACLNRQMMSCSDAIRKLKEQTP